MATELCRANLEEYIVGNKYRGPRFPSEKEMLHQLTQGLDHLHNLKIVHGDIKPTNILIFVPLEGAIKQPQIKLSDFKIYKMIETNKMVQLTNTILTSPSGSRGVTVVTPPELYNSNRFGSKVDVWALGCIFGYVLSGGKHPFGDGYFSQNKQIRRKQFMLLTKQDLKGNNDDAEAFGLIISMLMVEPQNRPTVEDVLKHPFFSSI